MQRNVALEGWMVADDVSKEAIDRVSVVLGVTETLAVMGPAEPVKVNGDGPDVGRMPAIV